MIWRWPRLHCGAIAVNVPIRTKNWGFIFFVDFFHVVFFFFVFLVPIRTQVVVDVFSCLFPSFCASKDLCGKNWVALLHVIFALNVCG